VKLIDDSVSVSWEWTHIAPAQTGTIITNHAKTLRELVLNTLPAKHRGHHPGLEHNGLAAAAVIEEMQPVGPQINKMAWRRESFLILLRPQGLIEPAKQYGKNRAY
jgi:hypothetical protein